MTILSLFSRRWLQFVFASLALLIAGTALFADQPADRPFVASVFGDNMVLQRNSPLPFWGWTAPGRRVTVRLLGASASAVAGPDGRWSVRLGAFSPGGPYTMSVSGPQTVVFHNVLIGDVYLCSGQSNMEFGAGNLVNPAAETAGSDNWRIRLFYVQRHFALTPQSSVSGAWDVCSPDALERDGGWNGFSAVAFFFARSLQEREHVPIGLIGTYWGGTPAQAWTSADALRKLADFRRETAAFTASYIGVPGEKPLDQQRQEWQDRNDLGSAQVKARLSPDYDVSSWKPITVPGYWTSNDLGDMVGSAWFRKDVDIPQAWIGKSVELRLGKVDDVDDAFVNGVRVGGQNGYAIERAYPLPAGLLRPGRNTILVRVVNTGGPGGIWGDPSDVSLAAADPDLGTISLAGSWLYGDADPVKAAATQNTITVLYNGMIAPLIPYAIRGAIWYQGESNSSAGYQYKSLFPAMISDWRRRWREGDFPFYFVQLAPYTPMIAEPLPQGTNSWADLREAQRLTLKAVPNAGMAVITDMGDQNDIHPKRKAPVGERLALIARAKIYGERGLEYSGPVVGAIRVEGDRIRVLFTHAAGLKPVDVHDKSDDGPLIASASKLSGFEVAGADRRYFAAGATIDGASVVASSPHVPHPVAVRYGWANYPIANLSNSAGLPASPFKSDDWPWASMAQP